MAAPEVQQLAREMEGRALVPKVDTEAYPDLAARLGAQSIPNFVVLRGGNRVATALGVPPAERLYTL